MQRILPALLAVAGLAGCAAAPNETGPAARASAESSADTAPAAPAALAMLASRYPLSPEQLSTTSESIFLGNLDARIDSADKALAQRDDPAQRAILAGALEHRHRITGRLADAERALDEIARVTKDPAASGNALLVHAALLSSFHRFDESLGALERAEAAGADPAVAKRLRRDLALARGDYASVKQDFDDSNAFVGDFHELAHRADLRVSLGDLDGATRLYRAAQGLYPDVDPLPLAWLYTQQGIALLRFGEFAEARRFFEAAHARLPSYALAAEHLAESMAETGDLEGSRALYLRVVEQTGNPEFIAALGDVEAKLGHEAASRERHAQAAREYDALLERHPGAYAQHAAEFHLERGNAARAYELAKGNLELRKDVGSLILHARAAEAAGARAEACASHRAVVATGLTPPELAELDTLAKACH